MTRVPSTLSTTTGSQPFSGSSDAINDLDLGTFLRLMIAELQNQDPLNPMDNKDMLAQISQIREVGATDRLTETLNSVLLGQSISSATNLIGADVEGLSDDNQRVGGVVKRISIENSEPKLHLELDSKAEPSPADGNVEAGRYHYRVVWEDDNGNLVGIGLGNVQTTGTAGVDRAVELTNLPKSSKPKFVYRTDHTGQGNFSLLSIINDGSQSTFVDRLSDAERSQSILQGQIRAVPAHRQFNLSLRNVSDIRPPEENVSTTTE
jgi:flagellar basal-body rod modification protein FlgD